MKTIKLINGIEMPMIGLGTWDLRGKQCMDTVKIAIDLGYRLIDTATMYGNEKEIGQAIGSFDRTKLFLTTKVYTTDASYSGTKKSVQRSLELLGTDYLDLVLIHEPYSVSKEMYKAMEEMMEQGLIRSIGVSNFHEEFYLNFIENCKITPAVDQVESHVYCPRLKLKDVLSQHGTVMQAWGPFTEGKKRIFTEPILLNIGREHHKTAAQVALRYLLQNGIPLVVKSSHEERPKENMDVFDFNLTEDEMQRIAMLDTGESLFHWYD